MNHSIASRVSLGVTYRLLLTSGHDAKRPLSRHDAQHGLHLSDGGRWEAALPSQYYFWRCSRCLLGVGFLLRLRLQSEALLHCQALHLGQIPVPRSTSATCPLSTQFAVYSMPTPVTPTALYVGSPGSCSPISDISSYLLSYAFFDLSGAMPISPTQFVGSTTTQVL